jgi:V/A-type H+-transporting ATPase subunit C
MKYGYSNARVKGMKGLLLKGSELDELLKVKNADAVIELLERTHYKEDLVKLSLLYKGSTLVELAAGRNFASVAMKIIRMCPKSDKKILEALLKRWDVLNLKVVIGARRLGKNFDDIRPYIVPVGSLSEAELERIMKCDDRAFLEEIRRTEFGKEMLSESMGLFNVEMLEVFRGATKNMDNLLQMQTFLDVYVYSYVDKHLVGSSKDIRNIKLLFRKEIDAKNIAIVERIKARGGADKSKLKDYIIKGGTINDSTLAALFDAKDFDAVLGVAKSRLSGLVGAEGNIKSLADLEIALEKAIAKEKVHVFYRSVLSIGTLMGFLLLKEEELNNLRKIAKGKEFNMPEEKLKETLVII